MNSVAPFQMVMVVVAENTLLRNTHKDPVCLSSWCMKPSRNGVLGSKFQAIWLLQHPSPKLLWCGGGGKGSRGSSNS